VPILSYSHCIQFQASVWGVINEQAAAENTREDEDLDATADKTVMR
jgi:hypothetical protein